MSCLYVDESKAKEYILVAAVLPPGDLEIARQYMRRLVLPRQRRIHFTKESDSRRRGILSQLTEYGFKAHVFQSAAQNDSDGRKQCLTSLVERAARDGHSRIVLERDESIMKADRQFLYQEVRRHGLLNKLTYELEGPYQEPLLWVADAIAWSYQKGGAWKQRVSKLIIDVTRTPS